MYFGCKKYGVPGRARLFEVVQKIKFANCVRRYNAPGRKFDGESCDSQELADQLILDLVEKGLVTNQIVLDVGYDIENIAKGYQGPVHMDHYGRKVPKPAHGKAGSPVLPVRRPDRL